jgi:tetratricopeptide (TPR) repeat protein
MNASPRILSLVGSALLLGVFVVPAEAQLTRDPQATAAYEEGIKLLGEEKWDDAIAAFGKATDIDNTFAEAYVGRADALRELEDYSNALTLYRQAESINPKIPGIYLGRGICYREIGEINLALNDFNNAMELDRSNPEVAANLGDLLANKVQDPTSALRVLDKAAELDPNNAEVFRNRGFAHAQLRHFDEAEADMAKSVELKSDDFETYSMQANIYLFQDKPEKLPLAIEALSKAVETYKPKETTDPKTYVQGLLLRSDANLKLATNPRTPEGEREDYFKNVIADADAVLAEAPDQYPLSGQALYRKGVALRMEGLYGEAIKAFTDAIQQLPPGESGSYAPEAYLKRGICWHMQGENRLARGDFQQAGSMDYTDPRPHLWTGFTYDEEGDFRSAIDAFGEAISKNPNFSLPYINRGLAYIQLKEFQRAADNFTEATRVDPTNPENHLKRGHTYMMTEEYEKAFNAYDLAQQYDKNSATAFAGAARALRALGRDAAAETYESRAQELKVEQN